MLRFLTTVLAVFVGLFLFVFFFFVVLVSLIGGASKAKPLPGNIVLKLDARQAIVDVPGSIGVPTSFGGPTLSVVGIVQALERASKDPSVKGLYIRADSSLGIEPGQAEEIRGAVTDFKAAGKFVISHVQDLSEPTLGGYYLASVADQVWMQPAGIIFLQGIGITSTYFKGTLDKLAVSADVANYYEYKDYFFPYIHTEPTDAEREENMRLITSIFDSMTGTMAQSRSMTKDQLAALLSQGPFTGPEAVKAHWIDKLGFDIDAEEAAKDRAGKDADLIDLGDYGRQKGSLHKGGAVIAFIPAEGTLVDGEARSSVFGDNDQFGGDTITKAILDATDDKDVKAIVFRINSPGGVATAPDQVLNAIARAQARGKPVVVNMAGLAASGGYWIATNADRIVAEPSTLTGSIGVTGAKFILKGLYDKVGVTSSEMSVGGDKVFMSSSLHPFTPDEWTAERKTMDVVYGAFIDRVAKGRKLPVAKVQEIAKGRVWSGSDAKDRGLVDELGGLTTAIAAAKRLAHISKDAPIELKTFPSEKAFVEQLMSAFGASAEAAHTLGVFAQVLKLEPATDLINALKADEQARSAEVRARMAPVTIR